MTRKIILTTLLILATFSTLLIGVAFAEPVDFTLTIEKGASTPLTNTKCYLFKGDSYQSQVQTTDATGQITYSVEPDTYKVRIDYLGYKFFTPEFVITEAATQTYILQHTDLTFNIGNAQPIANVKFYLYTETKTYTGKYIKSDASGNVIFSIPNKNYQARVDYAGKQYWFDTVNQTITQYEVPLVEQTVNVTQNTESGTQPLDTINVFAYTETGSYTGKYHKTDINGQTLFRLLPGIYKFRADYQAHKHWTDPAAINTATPVNIDTGGGTLTFKVQKDESTPIANLKTYVYAYINDKDIYASLWALTDSNGITTFNLASGTYKIRIDHMGQKYYTDPIEITQSTQQTYTIEQKDADFFIGDPEPIENIRFYLYTDTNAYTGQSLYSDDQGKVSFSIPNQNFKVRCDYAGQQVWIEPVNWDNLTHQVPLMDTPVTVTWNNTPIENVTVLVYSSTGAYTGKHLKTDPSGQVTFKLPTGDYIFKADYQSTRFESLITRVDNTFTGTQIATGGGQLTLNLLKGPNIPLTGVNCYVFTDTDTYVNLYQNAGDLGQLTFNLASGTYKIRIDYFGQQYWTDLYEITEDTIKTHTIEHLDISFTVGNPTPLPNVHFYLYTSTGSYTSIHLQSDTNGQVIFRIPNHTYKVRVDHSAHSYWFNDVTWSTPVNEVPIIDTQVTITRITQPLENIKVYAYGFTDKEIYTGQWGKTDNQGNIYFNLLPGNYKFRADYQGHQHRTATIIVDPLTPPVELDLGGGTFNFTLAKGDNTPISNVNCYVFTGSDAYTGLSGQTDANGQVNFELANGSYKIRADYLGEKYYTDTYEVPNTLSGTLTIEHRDVTFNIGLPTTTPIANVKFYLYKKGDSGEPPTGPYTNQYQVSDTNGQVTFSIPDKTFEVRADYTAHKYWFDQVDWNTTEYTVELIHTQITVTQNSNPIEGIKVYAYGFANDKNTYTGQWSKTDASGNVNFHLLPGTYKFRADYQSHQHWTDPKAIELGFPPIQIDLGGGTFTFTIQKDNNTPITNINCYVYNAVGSYTGLHAKTDDLGQVIFDLADGTYKIRADYLGEKYFTDNYDIPSTLSETLTIEHRDITFNIGNSAPIPNVKFYLYTDTGSYTSKYLKSDDLGQVIFSIPDMNFKVRVDYSAHRHWFDPVNWSTPDNTVPLVNTQVTVHQNQTPIENIKVFAYGYINDSNTYTGLYYKTDAQGQVTFELLPGQYKFRADYQGTQHLTDVKTIDQGTPPIDFNLGGGRLTYKLQKDDTTPLTNIRCYVYTQTGAYTGLYSTTDDTGTITFDLSSGTYKIRIDYLAYKFWQEDIIISADQTLTNTIPHKDITITARADSDTGNPLPNLRTNIYIPSGACTNLYGNTNESGQITFSLPDMDYTARVRYNSEYFLSNPFKWTDITVIIPVNPENHRPIADAGPDRNVTQGDTITLDGSWSSDDDNDPIIYLWSFTQRPDQSVAALNDPFAVNPTFTADLAGEYIVQLIVNDGKEASDPDTVIITAAPSTIAVPDLSGLTQTQAETAITNMGLTVGIIGTDFHDTIPVDNIISQNPAPGTQVQPNSAVDLVVSLGPAPPIPTTDITADPLTIPFGSISTLTWQSTDAITAEISDIGTVDTNGSTTVSPETDTDYTITVTGPGGTASDTVTITISPVITIHPTDQTISEGESATFTITAQGPDLTYQWQKNDTDITGANTSEYAINNATFDDYATYHCIVTNNAGSATSDPAQLIVDMNIEENTTPVANITASWDQGRALLSWDTESGYRYKILRGVAADQIADLTEVNQPPFTDTTSEYFNTYYYQFATIMDHVHPITNETISKTGPLSQTITLEAQPAAKVIISNATITPEGAYKVIAGPNPPYEITGTYENLSSPIVVTGESDQGATATGSGLDNTFTIQLSSADNWEITITAANGWLKGLAELIFAIDTEPPVLTINGPESQSTTQDMINITGTAHDTLSGMDKVVITSDKYQSPFAAILNTQGTFTSEVPLKPGDNILSISALDKAGNQTAKDITVTSQLTALPVLTIVSPKNNAKVNTDKITLSGTVRSSLPPEQIKLSLKNNNIFPTGTEGDYTFSFANVVLVKGPNTLQVKAETTHGIMTSQVIVTYEEEVQEEEDPPVVEIPITSPEIYVTGDSVIVSGSASSQNDIVSVTVNGVEIDITGMGGDISFETLIDIPTEDGMVEIIIVVTDANGNTTTTTYVVYNDSVAPVIDPDNTIQPAPDVNSVNETPYALTGTITDKYLAGVSINEQSISILPTASDDTYTFDIKIELTRDEEKHFTIEAWDFAGNRTSYELILQLDSTLDIEVITPTPDSTLVSDSATIDVKVTARIPGMAADDTVTAQIDANPEQDMDVFEGTANATLNIGAADGEHKLVVTARNSNSDILSKKSVTFSIVNTNNIPLQVIRQEPENNSKDVEPNEFIAFYFNKPINPQLLEIQVRETAHSLIYKKAEIGADLTTLSDVQLIEVHRDLEDVPGGVSHFPGNKQVAFYPTRDFAYEGNIYVTLLYNSVPINRSWFKIRPLPTFIQGFVLDQFGTPLAGIEISISDLERKVLTDANGNYGFGYGESASGSIPAGRYRAVINPGMKNMQFGSIETWISVDAGRINNAGAIQIPVLNKKQPFRRISSGDNQIILADEKLTLDLTNATLRFPNGMTKGDVHVQFMPIEEFAYGSASSFVPHWVFAFQPMGIEVYGSVELEFNLPPMYQSYDYINYMGEYVLLLGLDNKTLQMIPIGIGIVDNPEAGQKRIISHGPVELNRLEAIGYSQVAADDIPILEQFANDEINLMQLIGALEQ